MKMKLNIGERISLINFLNSFKGSMEEIKTASSLVSRLGINNEEQKAVDFRYKLTPDGKTQMNWDTEKDKEKEIDFTKEDIEVIKSQLDRVDKQKGFSMNDKPIIKVVEKLDIK